ncbi:hypothetical protein LAJ19_10030 [Deinococcus taeanensis]|uniref:hypothetical protein n=1 Tax=Deinococcus taeanensis TaxID=2737050 RepID=UPI001CDBD624|nr:hypothetical protein [Deinococcus taeanensis]UBV41976.1 hypothetical protein LAJ19_10030 [Deinococcus taeanensis]
MNKDHHPHPPDPWGVCKLFVHCELTGPEDTPHPANLETTASGFFPVHALPALSLGRILPEQVHLVAGLAIDPASAVSCD